MQQILRKDNMLQISSPSIISLPLAFVRSGWVDIAGSAASVVGQYGYHWSRVSNSIAGAYNLSIFPTDVGSSVTNGRLDAFPLRCLCMLERMHEKTV